MASIVTETLNKTYSASRSDRLDVFPAFFNVAQKRVVIVGGGQEAASKLRLLGENQCPSGSRRS